MQMQLFTFVMMMMMMLMLMVVPSAVQLAANRERAAAAHPSAPRHVDCKAGFPPVLFRFFGTADQASQAPGL
jgi:hypothetical protein